MLEIVLLLLVLAPIVAGLLLLLRRRALARHAVISACAVRIDTDARWSPGLLALSERTLEWYPVYGMSLSPACRWLRSSVEVGDSRAPADAVPWLLASHPQLRVVRLDGSGAGGESAQFSMMLPMASYTALRSWTESSPPVDSRWEY